MAVKQNRIRQELDKDTLSRLYLKEKKSTHAIAEITGWSPSSVLIRCKQYGLTLRKSWREKIKIDKSVLHRLYIDERKSQDDIATILSCNRTTVLRRLKEYKMPMRSGRIEGLTKRLLQKLYVKERRSTREIGKLFGCSRYPVQSRCREYGIPLRTINTKKIKIDEETLKRWYIKEGRSIQQITKHVGCCYSTIFRRIKRLGLHQEKREGR